MKIFEHHRPLCPAISHRAEHGPVQRLGWPSCLQLLLFFLLVDGFLSPIDQTSALHRRLSRRGLSVLKDYKNTITGNIHPAEK